MSFFCTHFWLSYIYISRESSLVINRDTISNDAISTLRVVRASIGLAGLSVEKFYRLATGRTEGLAFPTRACFSVGVVQAWLDNDTRISLDRVSKLEETWYLKESSGFQLFLPPFLSLLQRYQPSLREFKCNVHGSLHVTERESRWRYEREANMYIYINGALITIFTDLYDRARSNVLSNAYLTVHRIGHTRDTAIACYWTLSQHLGNQARYILLAAVHPKFIVIFNRSAASTRFPFASFLAQSVPLRAQIVPYVHSPLFDIPKLRNFPSSTVQEFSTSFPVYTSEREKLPVTFSK